MPITTDVAGVLSANRSGQTYTGGTLVANGRVTSPFSGSNSYANQGSMKYFGEWGAIEVGPNGTFDNNGNYSYDVYPFVLSGGKLVNTGCNMDVQDWQGYFGKVTLTADSTVEASRSTLLSRVDADLGGHVLTLNAVNGAYFDLAQNIRFSNGTLNVTGTGVMRIIGNNDAFDLTGTTWILGPQIRFEVYGNANRKVGNLTWNSERTDNYLNSLESDVLHVFGRFTPNTQTFVATEMQDGSTLDLSAKSDSWSVKSSVNDNYAVTFASGATVKVDLGTRRLSGVMKLVDWQELPGGAYAQPKNVRFVAVSGGALLERGLANRRDGLYYTCGFVLTVR